MEKALVRLFLLVSLTSSLVACGSDDLQTSLDALAPKTEALTPKALAPAAVWSWIDVPGAVCGNGSPTGFAVNLNPNSDRLLILYEGGGACYDALSCYVLHTAAYVTTGYNEETFRTNRGELERLQTFAVTDRQDPNNPFADISFAYIPYCTGDVHGGTNVIRYPGPYKQPIHHVGFLNGQLFTQVLAQALPQVQHVWVSGYSAGGFGATFHYADTQEQFPQARIDLIDDSGESFPDTPLHDSWGLNLPEDCDTCDRNNFASLVQYYSRTYPQSRFATLSYSDDRVLPLYFHLSKEQFAAKMRDYEAVLDALPNTRYFVFSGTGHVLMRKKNPVINDKTLAAWLTDMVNDEAEWQSYK